MNNLLVGHVSHHDSGTGLSVFLFPEGAVGSYQLCGSGPASHELAPLDPETSVAKLHGLLLTGGSAYGLAAVKGVMDYLTERHIGLPLPHGVVPIVPAVGIYDLMNKKATTPSAEDAYKACTLAKADNTESGMLGAGTGATIGKIIPDAQKATAGLGRAELTLPSGVRVIAYVTVNAIGDVWDKGRIVAGARANDGQFADCTKMLLSGAAEAYLFERGHTTLAAVFTNAVFSKAELKRVAKMGVAGMARAISPVFSCYDGDILFAISVGQLKASVLTIGAMAAEAVRLAILDAVRDSTAI